MVMRENKYEKDTDFIHLIDELKRIEKANDSKAIIYNFGRIYNDAMNHLVALYQIDGEKAMEIIDKLVKEND